MKKIMIYSKHGQKNTFGTALKNNAGIIMYYSIFICGLFFGCTLYNRAEQNSFYEWAANLLINNSAGKNMAFLAVFSLLAVLIAITGALSCAGTGILCIIPAFGGIIYSQIASFLLTDNAAKGLGYFCLIILPGAAMLTTSIIALCAESGNISKKLALTNIFGKREEINFRMYVIKCAVVIALIMVAILINFICVKLFSKLF